MSAIVITGTLARDAEYRRTVDGAACVCIVISQAGTYAEIHGQYRMGKGASAEIAAERKARRMRRGTRVKVHAGSAGVGYRVPQPEIQLHDVERIEEPDLAVAEREGVQP